MADATELVSILNKQGRILTTAESCTGGMIAASITDISGSSLVFDRGFVTYSNQSKTEMLSVPAELIEQHGAVSEAVAKAMAEGALANSSANICISTTGIAGPTGGSDEKPVGLVYIAVAMKNKTHCTQHHFTGDRQAVREQTLQTALQIAIDALTQ